MYINFNEINTKEDIISLINSEFIHKFDKMDIDDELYYFHFKKPQKVQLSTYGIDIDTYISSITIYDKLILDSENATIVIDMCNDISTLFFV